jgi:hypothetical protein
MDLLGVFGLLLRQILVAGAQLVVNGNLLIKVIMDFFIAFGVIVDLGRLVCLLENATEVIILRSR